MKSGHESRRNTPDSRPLPLANQERTSTEIVNSHKCKVSIRLRMFDSRL